MSLYRDGLAAGWLNASWNADVTVRSTHRPYNGATAITFQVRRPWGALYLRSRAGVRFDSQSVLRIAIRTVTAGQRYNVLIYGANERPIGRALPVPPAGRPGAKGTARWRMVTLRLKRLGRAGGTLSGIAIQDALGRAQPEAQIDSIWLRNLPSAADHTATPTSSATEEPTPRSSPTPRPTATHQPTVLPSPTPSATETPAQTYPWHTNVVATVFWVGEPKGNGSSEDNALSAYDDAWQEHYGGFDDPTYRRSAVEDYLPRGFEPQENPFYLDVPFDDLNVARNRRLRTSIIPWARGKQDPGRSYSFMKNRWVELVREGRTCYGQIQDAGPYVYDDVEYVFGGDDRRPRSQRANNAGLDVSPALRDCLGFTELNGNTDTVDWRFVEASDVPDGPWTRIVTRSQVFQP